MKRRMCVSRCCCSGVCESLNEVDFNDDFNRSNGAAGNGWTEDLWGCGSSGFNILSNVLRCGVPSFCARSSLYRDTSFDRDLHTKIEMNVDLDYIGVGSGSEYPEMAFFWGSLSSDEVFHLRQGVNNNSAIIYTIRDSSNSANIASGDSIRALLTFDSYDPTGSGKHTFDLEIFLNGNTSADLTDTFEIQGDICDVIYGWDCDNGNITPFGSSPNAFRIDNFDYLVS